MKMVRCLSGHTLVNIGGELVSEVLILRNGISKYPREDYNWGLYFRYQGTPDEVPSRNLLTRDDIKGTKNSYSPEAQGIVNSLLCAGEEEIKTFCLCLMECFCRRLNSSDIVIPLRFVLIEALGMYDAGK